MSTLLRLRLLPGATLCPVTDGGDAGFGEILASWAWWDRPLSGLTLVEGRPHRFLCEFDEELDDYPDEYEVWPISAAAVEAELAFWRLFVEWRARFDSGQRPGSFEQEPEYASLKKGVQQYQDGPPRDARVGVPEWLLDRNRSFVGRVPRHYVRWTFMDQTQGPARP
jgi:hypothetical protein